MADNNLYPVVDIPEYEEENEEYDTEYKPSVAWDLEKGDFVCESPFCMLKSEGLEAYKTWCVKAVATERYSCLGYDDDIGAEMEDAMKEEDDTAVELAIERTIEETLMVNPRTESVEDFEFEWEPSVVHVKFIVYAIHWEKFDLEVTAIDTDIINVFMTYIQLYFFEIGAVVILVDEKANKELMRLYTPFYEDDMENLMAA